MNCFVMQKINAEAFTLRYPVRSLHTTSNLDANTKSTIYPVILPHFVQVPEEFPLEVTFDAAYNYLITKPHLYDRLIAVYVHELLLTRRTHQLCRVHAVDTVPTPPYKLKSPHTLAHMNPRSICCLS